jgi:transglutaminase-like putative cysteine protease
VSAAAVPSGALRPALAAGAPLASPARVRVLAFAGLALFGSLHWAAFMRPAPWWRLVLCAALAVGVTLAAERIARLSLAARVGARLGLLVVLAGAVLLAAGVPLRLLAPARWGDLTSGIGQGIDSLPGIGTPYRGVDPWVRIDLVAGGALLLLAAGLLAARARRRERAPLAAALLLSAVFVVPVVEHAPAVPFLWGAVFTVLLGALLWADRLERAYLPGVTVFVAVALGAGLFAAPRLDTDSPWLDYQAIVESLTNSGGVRFDWNHGYGPLNWPRHNREMLRVASSRPAYWKAVDLDAFDGRRWHATGQLPRGIDTEFAPNHGDWRIKLRVSVRGLRTNAYIAAGTGLSIEHSPRYAIPSAAGTFATGSEPLRHGDTYVATVYSPHPSVRELRDAGTAYPAYVHDYLTMDLPASVGGPVSRLINAPSTLPPTQIEFAPFSVLSARAPPRAHNPDGTDDLDGGALLAQSQYAELYDLAHTLRAKTFSPYDYLRRIEARLSKGYAYSESPPKPAPGRPPLVSFLFDTHVGYCQQFSGAMALLLRMGGIPARVGSGFTPGTYDRGRREWVVRDVDAHSWVEAYFPNLGWVTFDPTPGAAPPRTQLLNEPLPPNAREIPLRTDQRRADVPNRGGAGGSAAIDGSAPISIWLVLILGLLVGMVLTAAAFAWRSWRHTEEVSPELAELARALRVTGRPMDPPLTLRALEERYRRDAPGASAYVAAVRLARFGGRSGEPSREQRAALRAELGSGLGWTGRLRAWWALPPDRLRPGRVYTGR